MLFLKNAQLFHKWNTARTVSIVAMRSLGRRSARRESECVKKQECFNGWKQRKCIDKQVGLNGWKQSECIDKQEWFNGWKQRKSIKKQRSNRGRTYSPPPL